MTSSASGSQWHAAFYAGPFDPESVNEMLDSNYDSFALAAVLRGGNGPYTVTYSHSGWGSTYTCASAVEFGSGAGKTAHIMVNPSTESCTIAYY